LHPAIWLSFFFHDLGYWGKPNMDGKEGETHVEFGAKVLHFIFDGYCYKYAPQPNWMCLEKIKVRSFKWYNFSKYHSRFYAKKDGVNYSKLCVADKLAICLEPYWFYLPRVNLSGEIHEYMKLAKQRENNGELVSKYESMKLSTKSQKDWFEAMTSYLLRWVEEHKDGKNDTWTPNTKQAINENGIWK